MKQNKIEARNAASGSFKIITESLLVTRARTTATNQGEKQYRKFERYHECSKISKGTALKIEEKSETQKKKIPKNK